MRRYFSGRIIAAMTGAFLLGAGTVGVLTAGSALAGGAGVAAMAFGGPWGGGHALPPELAALRDLPPAERFKHFNGAQVSLKDANNQPLTILVTPGTVSAASGTSVTVAANDGTTKTYAIGDKTVVRSRPSDGSPNNTPNLSQGDMVVVVTQNGETTARAIIDGNKDGFGRMGGHGPFGGPFGPGR